MNILRIILKKAVSAAGALGSLALDVIAPPDPDIRRIERMPLDGFKSLAFPPARFDAAEGMLSFFPYRTPEIKAALIEMKTYRNKAIARKIAQAFFEELVAEASELTLFSGLASPLLVPVPMTKERMRERGWNQCELVLEALRSLDRGSIFDARRDVLAKVRENEDQVGKGRAERFENLRGCFAVPDPAKAEGRDAIVFDDILTTGATLGEAKWALCAAGARRVLLASFAH